MARWRESLRFHLPLIEPDMRISGIRLSEKVHAFACGKRVGVPLQLKQAECLLQPRTPLPTPVQSGVFMLGDPPLTENYKGRDPID